MSETNSSHSNITTTPSSHNGNLGNTTNTNSTMAKSPSTVQSRRQQQQQRQKAAAIVNPLVKTAGIAKTTDNPHAKLKKQFASHDMFKKVYDPDEAERQRQANVDCEPFVKYDYRDKFDIRQIRLTPVYDEANGGRLVSSKARTVGKEADPLIEVAQLEMFRETERQRVHPKVLNAQQREIYTYWRDGDGQQYFEDDYERGIVTIQAGPGCGKSFTLKSLIHHAIDRAGVIIFKHDLLQEFRFAYYRATVAGFIMNVLGLNFKTYEAIDRQISRRMSIKQFFSVMIAGIKKAKLPSLVGCTMILDEYTVVSKPFLTLLLILFEHHHINVILCGDKNQLQNIHNSPHAAISSFRIARSFSTRVFTLERNERCLEKDYAAFIQHFAKDSSTRPITLATKCILAAYFPRQMTAQPMYHYTHLASTHEELTTLAHSMVCTYNIPVSFHVLQETRTSAMPTNNEVAEAAYGSSSGGNSAIEGDSGSSAATKSESSKTKTTIKVPPIYARVIEEYQLNNNNIGAISRVGTFLPYLPLQVNALYYIDIMSELSLCRLVHIERDLVVVRMVKDNAPLTVEAIAKMKEEFNAFSKQQNTKFNILSDEEEDNGESGTGGISNNERNSDSAKKTLNASGTSEIKSAAEVIACDKQLKVENTIENAEPTILDSNEMTKPITALEKARLDMIIAKRAQEKGKAHNSTSTSSGNESDCSSSGNNESGNESDTEMESIHKVLSTRKQKKANAEYDRMIEDNMRVRPRQTCDAVFFPQHLTYIKSEVMGNPRVYNFPIYPANFMSIHKSQGCTITDQVNLLVSDRLTFQHLYVAISRVQRRNQIVRLDIAEGQPNLLVSTIINFKECVATNDIPIDIILKKLNDYIYYDIMKIYSSDHDTQETYDQSRHKIIEMATRFFYVDAIAERKKLRHEIYDLCMRERVPYFQLRLKDAENECHVMNESCMTITKIIEHRDLFKALATFHHVDAMVWINEYLLVSPNMRDLFEASVDGIPIVNKNATMDDYTHTFKNSLGDFATFNDTYSLNIPSFEYIRSKATVHIRLFAEEWDDKGCDNIILQMNRYTTLELTPFTARYYKHAVKEGNAVTEDWLMDQINLCMREGQQDQQLTDELLETYRLKAFTAYRAISVFGMSKCMAKDLHDRETWDEAKTYFGKTPSRSDDFQIEMAPEEYLPEHLISQYRDRLMASEMNMSLEEFKKHQRISKYDNKKKFIESSSLMDMQNAKNEDEDDDDDLAKIKREPDENGTSQVFDGRTPATKRKRKIQRLEDYGESFGTATAPVHNGVPQFNIKREKLEPEDADATVSANAGKRTSKPNADTPTTTVKEATATNLLKKQQLQGQTNRILFGSLEKATAIGANKKITEPIAPLTN